ncbi:hypothetical protein ABMY44_15630 [Pseudoalteromonas sp. Cnat2-41]|uniref:hypothetical protein n=1 Tax=unclassified Pseudoalteromonas TaxID=194690 RepID=UPI001EF79795|nr:MULTISPECIES: hypothetical protein [unclassified Pseudoalteromonas]MCF2863764.1 hypothetical protein [Pseudoalteromonas sp. CNAT2-18]MCG7559486.1 hypothetical protein [Pseudoalteromonas sp. CNAT2-18.1]
MPGPFLHQKPHQHPSITRGRNQAALRRDLNKEQHDIYALTKEEFVRLWIEFHKRRNKTIEEVKDYFSRVTALSAIESAAWFGANLGSAVKDTSSLIRLVNDFKKSGNILGKYSIVTKNGKEYVVFKGNHKLRSIVTSARYPVKSPKLMTVGVGHEAIKAGAKQGFLISIVFSITLNTINWIFQDEYRWTNWLATTATDVVKILIASLAGIIAAAMAGTVTVVALVGGILVAVLLGFWLAWGDGQLGVTKALIEVLNQFEERLKRKEQLIKHKIDECIQEVYYVTSRAIIKVVEIAVSERLRRLLASYPYSNRRYY